MASKNYFIVVEQIFNHSLRELISVHHTIEEAEAAKANSKFSYYKREIISSSELPINDEMYEDYFTEIERLKMAKEDYEAYRIELNIDGLDAAFKDAEIAYKERFKLFQQKVILGEIEDNDSAYEAFMADVIDQQEKCHRARNDAFNNERLRELYNAQFEAAKFGKLSYDLRKLLNQTAYKCSECGCLTNTGCVCTI